MVTRLDRCETHQVTWDWWCHICSQKTHVIKLRIAQQRKLEAETTIKLRSDGLNS